MPRSLYTPFGDTAESFVITPELAARYRLDTWSRNFALGTAGYRDLLDPDDLFSPEVPFNAVTVAVMLLARAQLAKEHGLQRLHVGGEVRPHTQEFIDLAARIYAAPPAIARATRAAGSRWTRAAASSWRWRR